MVVRYRWRVRAKVVAYLDLMLSCMALLTVIGLSVFAGIVTDQSSATLDNAEKSKISREKGNILDDAKATIEDAMDIVWISAVMIALYTIAALWASLKLVNGTEIGREPVEAHRLCAIWRNVCIVLMLLDFISNAATAAYIIEVIYFAFRAILLLVVHNFTGELKKAAEVPAPAPDPLWVATSKQ